MAMAKSQGSAIKEKQSSLVEPRDYGGHSVFVYFMSFVVPERDGDVSVR